MLLVPVASTGGRDVQETVLDDGEDGGHRLISYATVLVSNREVNVAVYRA